MSDTTPEDEDLAARLAVERARCEELERLLAAERATSAALRVSLGEIERAQGWRLARSLRQQKERWAPEGTRPRKALTWLTERAIRALGNEATPAAIDGLGAADERPRVLIVSGCGGDSLRYRGEHLVELLGFVGARGAIVSLAQLGAARDPASWLERCELVVCQRTPLEPGLSALIAAANTRGTPVLFETDDLVCDPHGDASDVPSLAGLVTRAEVDAQHATLQRADGALCSTEFLASRLRALGKPTHVLRNAASPAMREAAARARAAGTGRLVVGYASGSPSHDGDLASIAEPLARILKRFPEVELQLVGPVAVPRALADFASRITCTERVPHAQLPEILAGFAINLAPLEGYAFCRAKSAIKWLEAALVGVPTVASATPAFQQATAEGQFGALATNDAEWERALATWIEDPAARHACGAAAREHALAQHSLEQRGADLGKILAAYARTPDSN